MAQVHTYTVLTELEDDFRIPIQYLGAALSPAPRAIPAPLLIEFLLTKLGIGATPQPIADGDTITIGAGVLINVIAVKAASGARTIQIGTSSGGDDILSESDIDSGADFSASIGRYTSTPLTLHFTISSGTAQVLVFTSPEI